MKKNILITGPYLPDKSSGGPVKSLYNMVETLSEYYNFFIITGDRELNSNNCYKGVNIGEWNDVGKGKVLYVPRGDINKYIRKTIKEIDFDLIYASSFFAKPSIIIQILKWLNIIKKPVIVAPRGEFSTGALGIKSLKKRIYLFVYKLLRIHKKIVFTCTSENDKKDILKVIGDKTKIYIAGNIVNNDSNVKLKKIDKKPKEIKIVTLSRIARIKNIDYSLQVFKKLIENKVDFNSITFDIFGPLEDKKYYSECLNITNDINGKIEVNFRGPIDYGQVIEVLSDYHVFLFPTKGENFGHVIQEALLAGCPVIISDQTPWRDLKKLNVGFDIPLENKKKFIDAIKYYLYMDDKEYELASKKAYEYGIDRVKNQLAIKENVEMFDIEIK